MAFLAALAIALSGSLAVAAPAAGTDRVPPLIAERAKLVEQSATNPVGTLGCQPISAAFRMHRTDGYVTILCSGTHSLNFQATHFEAGGWSGIVHYGTSSTWAFCDWENWNFPYYARYVEVYATKASWC